MSYEIHYENLSKLKERVGIKHVKKSVGKRNKNLSVIRESNIEWFADHISPVESV